MKRKIIGFTLSPLLSALSLAGAFLFAGRISGSERISGADQGQAWERIRGADQGRERIRADQGQACIDEFIYSKLPIHTCKPDPDPDPLIRYFSRKLLCLYGCFSTLPDVGVSLHARNLPAETTG